MKFATEKTDKLLAQNESSLYITNVRLDKLQSDFSQQQTSVDQRIHTACTAVEDKLGAAQKATEEEVGQLKQRLSQTQMQVEDSARDSRRESKQLENAIYKLELAHNQLTAFVEE